MEINDNEIGYKDALEAVIKRRLLGQEKYGNRWLEDNMEDLYFLVQMKARRVAHSKAKDALIDSLIDLCNYSLFCLQRELLNTGKFKDE